MNTVRGSTCDLIGGVVVTLVWDVVDPVARTVDSARRALSASRGVERPGRGPATLPESR
jgi:hypothetical protein